MNKFGIRKFTVGTASVVVGSMMFLGLNSADAAEATYTLGDRVFSDNNGNYVQDAGDTGLAGLTVTIRDYAGNHVATTVTDANGNYSFSGLKNGTYIVNFQVPTGYANDVANIGSEDVDSDGPIDVLVDIKDANVNTLDTGFIPLNGQAPAGGGEVKPAEPAPTTPPAEGGGEVKPAPAKGNLSIGDHVWWDANSNNLYDEGENPVANLEVTIHDYAGNFVDRTFTDEYGNYAFHGLSDGQYIVYFHNPLDWSPVIANIDNDVSEAIDSDGPINVIVNLKGESNFNVDQGYYGVGTPGPTPPAGGGEVTPPAGGGEVTPPAGGGEVTPPAGGGEVTPPAGGGEVTPPAGGGEVTPPAGGGEVTPPAGGGEVTPPAETKPVVPADTAKPEVTTPTPAEATQPAAPVETVKPAEIGKTVLPDTGEKDNNGVIASVLALLGGAALLGSRRK
ncbi:SdrD B-like domain-containing protein [Macrococcus animalis]|uniref:SdrD B-like domain-containing protein n=1 Tax=Macrococcus animalis TaxID=3395467 RepID=UPI0039BE4C6C